VLPARAVTQFKNSDDLYIAPLAMPVSDPLYITTKRHFALANRYQWFLTFISEHLQ